MISILLLIDFGPDAVLRILTLPFADFEMTLTSCCNYNMTTTSMKTALTNTPGPVYELETSESRKALSYNALNE